MSFVPTGTYAEGSVGQSLMYMIPDDPSPESVTTETVTDEFTGEELEEVQGLLTFELEDTLTISFTSGSPSKEIKISGDGRLRLEFQAVVDCSTEAVQSPTPTVTFQGSNTVSAEAQYNAENSFLDVGRCEGCGQCEIYTRLEFDAPQDMQFSAISWTVDLEPSILPAEQQGEVSYTIGSNLYMWIRSPDNENSKRATQKKAPFLKIEPTVLMEVVEAEDYDDATMTPAITLLTATALFLCA